jgi:hypothetical protein
VTAVSAPFSLPIHPTATGWAAAVGVPENPVGVIRVAFAVVRLLAGTGVCLHSVCAGTGSETEDDAGERIHTDGDTGGIPGGDGGSSATMYAPLPSR